MIEQRSNSGVFIFAAIYSALRIRQYDVSTLYYGIFRNDNRLGISWGGHVVSWRVCD